MPSRPVVGIAVVLGPEWKLRHDVVVGPVSGLPKNVWRAREWHIDSERLQPLVILLVGLAHEEVGYHVSTDRSEAELFLTVKDLRAPGVGPAACA